MIYLDNAATTKQEKTSLEVQNFFATEKFFNPSAIYANENAVNLENAKKIIAERLGVKFNNNIIFTGSATEANNLVLTSLNDNFVISAGEHPSVYNTALQFQNQKKDVKICPLQTNGEINYEKLEETLDENTKLISIIHVSNETGAINDLKKISEIKKRKCPNALLHSDGVQAFCKLDYSISEFDVDFYTVSAHKIGGPKGIGALFAKNKNKLKPLIFGGEQEYGLRSGTENLPSIMAFANIVKTRKNNMEKIQEMRKFFLQNLFGNEKNISKSEIKFNVENENTSPYILNLRFDGVNGETLVNLLKTKEIFISRGSACSSKKEGNRVLKEIGLNEKQIKSSVRISFLESNTFEEIKLASSEIKNVYNELKEHLNI